MAQQQSGNVKTIFTEVLSANLPPQAFEWLLEKTHSSAQLASSFAAIPRKTGKKLVMLDDRQRHRIAAARTGLRIDQWTTDRLARVWLLLHLDSSDKDKYVQTIEALFPAAEVNELVALYSALPVLQFPESWTARCSEGIRSNIGDVLTAIMCDNPYPADYLNDAAWNQLVLKAFFTEKRIGKIIGLDERTNRKLAQTLSDYAHERWAAHRSVNPLLWRCVGKQLDEMLLPDIERLFGSDNELERKAAALACSASSYPPAKDLLTKHQGSSSDIQSGALTWEKLEENNLAYVLQQ